MVTWWVLRMVSWWWGTGTSSRIRLWNPGRISWLGRHRQTSKCHKPSLYVTELSVGD